MSIKKSYFGAENESSEVQIPLSNFVRPCYVRDSFGVWELNTLYFDFGAVLQC